MALTIMKPPGEFGVDIALGTSQRSVNTLNIRLSLVNTLNTHLSLVNTLQVRSSPRLWRASRWLLRDQGQVREAHAGQDDRRHQGRGGT